MSAAYARGRKGHLSVHIPAPGGGTVIRSTGTADVEIVADIEDALALLKRKRMWDVLQAVIDKRHGFTLDDVRDAWAGENIGALRERLADVDIEPHVTAWVRTLVARFGEPTGKGGDTVTQYRRQVRTLLAEGVPFLRSQFTPERLSAWLYGLADIQTGTRLRYYAAMSQFAAYLVRLRVLDANPMESVDTPKESPKRDRYLEHPDVLRLVAAQPYPFNVASALVHLGIEAGVVPVLAVRDVDLAAGVIRAKGTKNDARDRLAYITPWARPYVERAVRGKLADAWLIDRTPMTKGPHAGKVPNADAMYRRLYAAHNAACTALGVADYRQHDARHSYAVRLMATGAPAAVAAAQLGHANEKEVNERYGRFKATIEDRERWEQRAAERDAERQRPRREDVK
jgi:integrase